MTTTLAIIGLLFIIGTFYVLQDTISEALCGGKSFMPAEMKGFNDGRTYKKTNQTMAKKQLKRKDLLLVLIDTATVIVAVFIAYKVISEVLNSLNL